MKIIKMAVSWLALALALSYINVYSDNRISLYLKHAPDDVIRQCIAEAKDQSLAEKIAHLETKTPGEVSKKLMKNGLRQYFTPSLSGFIAVYGGYMDISNPDGLLVFPLRHATSKIYVAIAPAINLVNVKGATISHREFQLSDASKLYLFERKTDKKKIIHWSVHEEKIPDNKKINPITLVIFAQTKNIYVPEGDFLAAESSHLILPDIYVIGNFDQEKILLQALDLQRYFERINEEEKKAGDNSTQKLIVNT